MPVISRFFGIIIFMLWREHNPPHFHAKYGEDEITVEIESGKVNGTMSKRALNMIEEWHKLHKEELLHNWKSAEAKKAFSPIKPLE
ncbi:MAG: DUF4160 domain-containing protein [Candidatus Schekmanbacteria bacterium]|nr:DUF4160 domain-containing protein [Candidatus Schekmanbacteria bacterium]